MNTDGEMFDLLRIMAGRNFFAVPNPIEESDGSHSSKYVAIISEEKP